MKKICGYINLLILVMILFLLVGCGGSASENENKDIQLQDKSEVQETKIASSNFLNGISKDYDMNCTRMVSPEQVIADFNNEGYQYVYLEGHEAKLGDGNGYAGSIDTVTLTCTHVDVNELWYETEKVQAQYSYWGDENGATWNKPVIFGELEDSSFDGFNGTYWEVRGSNRYLFSGATSMFNLTDEDLGLLQSTDFHRSSDYDRYWDALNVCMYLSFENFGSYKASMPNWLEHNNLTLSYSKNEAAPVMKITLIFEGDVYEKTVTPTITIQNGIMSIMYQNPDGVAGAYGFDYDPSKTKNSSVGATSRYIVLLTEDEYNTAIQTSVEAGAQAEEEAKKAGPETYDNIYEQDYSKILDEILENYIDLEGYYGYYCLCDINDDGLYELIVGYGKDSANFKNEIYRYVENSGNSCYYMGRLDSEQIFYYAPDGDGIYAVYGHMGHEVITRLSFLTTYSLTELVEEVVSDKDIDFANGESYYSNDMPIEESDFEDRDLLKRMTALMASGNGSDDNVGEAVNETADNNSVNNDSNKKANDDYVLAESNTRYYSAEELSDLSKDDLRIARNEIYARHGRIFDSADLDEYFRSKSWYNPTTTASQFDESILNDYEKKNADMIKSVENRN